MTKLFAIIGILFISVFNPKTVMVEKTSSNLIELSNLDNPTMSMFDFSISDDDNDKKKKDKYKPTKAQKIGRALVFVFVAAWVVIAAILGSNAD